MLDLDKTFSEASLGYFECPDLTSIFITNSPVLQEETWRKCGVLTNFLMLDLDESFSKASFVYFEYPDPISQEIINAKTYH